MKKPSRSMRIMEDVNDLYFFKGTSIKNICSQLKCSNTSVSLAIETIIRDRANSKEKKFVNIKAITDAQVIKQNEFIEKHTLIRNRYADPILLTNSQYVLEAYNKMVNTRL